MPAEQFLEQVDERRPRALRSKGIVSDAVDLEVACVRIGEAVADMAIGVDLPVAARLGELLAERDDFFGRDHRIVPAVEGDHLRLDLLRRKSGRVEQAMEGDRCRQILAGAGNVERALAAEAIAGDDELAFLDFIEAARLVEQSQQPPTKRCSISTKPAHLAEHRIARSAAELLPEQVGDQRVVPKFDQLPAEADFERRNAHHRRDQDYGRSRLSIAAAHENMLKLLALELERDAGFLAHAASISFAACARASSVMEAPESIRAISSRLSASSSLRTVVRVPC